MFSFEIKNNCKDSRARTGKFNTPHGDIQTPCFMPVGTKASVKTLTNKNLDDLQAEIILANTYHLEIRPGSELIKKMGGLHDWMSWNKPILTDSGGFQVFSLAGKRNKNKEKLVKITEEGVHFKSHLDGSKLFFSPEKAIEIQHNLGADIIMAFDECIASGVSKEYTAEATERTHRWLKRCKDYHLEKNNSTQALFGIVQGGMYEDLRKESAEFVSSQNLPGIAIGGLSVGEKNDLMYEVLDYTIPSLPNDKIKYLMGVGEPLDLLEAIHRGVDIFDCVLPTRLARHGTALTGNGKLNLQNEQYKQDNSPIDSKCECYCCQNFSRSYLRHLIRENEITVLSLLSMHNIHYLISLIKEIRIAIDEDNFKEFYNKTKKDLTSFNI